MDFVLDNNSALSNLKCPIRLLKQILIWTVPRCRIARSTSWPAVQHISTMLRLPIVIYVKENACQAIEKHVPGLVTKCAVGNLPFVLILVLCIHIASSVAYITVLLLVFHSFDHLYGKVGIKGRTKTCWAKNLRRILVVKAIICEFSVNSSEGWYLDLNLYGSLQNWPVEIVCYQMKLMTVAFYSKFIHCLIIYW